MPLTAQADNDDRGEHHGKHRGNQHGDRGGYGSEYGYYGPPPAYYGGPPPCRGPKRVKVYNNYYPVPVPVAVPVYPAYPQYPDYPQQYPSSGSNAVVRIGVDWIFGF